jgi:hypothetical protein
MSSEAPVNARTTNANEDSQSPGGPSGMGVDMTICADAIFRALQQFLFTNVSIMSRGENTFRIAAFLSVVD